MISTFPFLTSPSNITSGNDPHAILPWVDDFVSPTNSTSTHESPTESSIINSPVVSSHNHSTPELSQSEVSIPSSPINLDVPARVSTRTKTRPQWWKDYDISSKSASLLLTVSSLESQVSSSSKYALANYISYSSFPSSHQKFIANLSHVKEPTYFA